MELTTNNFTITDDKTADWAVKQIKDAEEERDRLIKLAEEEIADLETKIEDLKAACENQTKYLKSCLGLYFETVPHKETKTQKSYKLLSGSLVFKKASQKIDHNDDKLLTYLEDSDQEQFIKVKKSVDWANFKKRLAIQDGKVVDIKTGEIIDGCTVEDTLASFNIKFS